VTALLIQAGAVKWRPEPAPDTPPFRKPPAIDSGGVHMRPSMHVRVGSLLVLWLPDDQGVTRTVLALVTRFADSLSEEPQQHCQQLADTDVLPVHLVIVHTAASLHRLGSSKEAGGKCLPHAHEFAQHMHANEGLVTQQEIFPVLVSQVVAEGAALWQDKHYYRSNVNPNTNIATETIDCSPCDSHGTPDDVGLSDQHKRDCYAPMPGHHDTLARCFHIMITGAVNFVKLPCEYLPSGNFATGNHVPYYEMCVSAVAQGPIGTDGRPVRHPMDKETVFMPPTFIGTEREEGVVGDVSTQPEVGCRHMPCKVRDDDELQCRWNMFDRAHIAVREGLGPSLLLQKHRLAEQVRAWMRVISGTGSDVQARDSYEIGNTTAHDLSLEVVLCALFQHGILAHVGCGPNIPARGPQQELYPQCVQEPGCNSRDRKCRTKFPAVNLTAWQDVIYIRVQDLDNPEFRSALDLPTEKMPFVSEHKQQLWLGCQCALSNPGQGCHEASSCSCWISIHSFPHSVTKSPCLKLSACVSRKSLAGDTVTVTLGDIGQAAALHVPRRRSLEFAEAPVGSTGRAVPSCTAPAGGTGA
jgi:hypothetical protein